MSGAQVGMGGIDGVPVLGSGDLRVELQGAYRQRRQHHLFAFFGTGEEQVIDIDDGQVRVVPVRSEIELRERMPPLTTTEDRVAYLVPWTHDIPLDLSGRFAHQGRVRKIGTESRLRALFGVADVDDEARRSPLAAYLLRPGQTARYACSEARLSLNAMWSMWLRSDWGLDTDGGLALDTILAFAATDGRGPQFLDAMRAPGAGATRDELLTWMGTVAGPAAVVAWRCWESGQGRRAVQVALLCEALARSDESGVQMWLRERIRPLCGGDDLPIPAIVDAFAREVGSAMRLLERRVSAQDLRALAIEADNLVNEPLVRAALIESNRLPTAWQLRLDRLGECLLQGVKRLDVDAANAAIRALRALDTHVFFKSTTDDARRADMAVRLLCWLVARPDRRIEPGFAPQGDAEALGRWFAEEGGYVDRARRAARGTAQDPFGRGVQAVVDVADAERSTLDRRFATSLASWQESGQPSERVTPIHDAIKRFAVKFLGGHEERSLLVLLMDGMAWAQAAVLLESLGSRASSWAPLAWHGTREHRVGEGALPVVFAALPTITEVSRSSFFAGKPFGPGAKRTTDDRDHWSKNTLLKKFVPPTEQPRLLLRAESHTSAGVASQEALSLVQDATHRIVGIVVNAIDDSLKGSHAARHDWGVENIASLPSLFDAARVAGRCVLLASDHGHVTSERLERVTPESGGKSLESGARWRALPSKTAPLLPAEMAFAGPHVFRPAGAEAVALLADDATTYTPNIHAGEHGGATLAEVVAPCVLLGNVDVAGDPTRQDPGLMTVAAPVPRWWHFDLVADVVVEEPLRTPPKVKRVEPSIGLFGPAPEASPPPPPPSTAAAAVVKPVAPVTAFGTSEVLKARVKNGSDRQGIVHAVDLLLSRQGVMSSEAFGAALRLQSYRVQGIVSKYAEVLNLDGYEVIRYDPADRQVRLDRAKLEQLFEVKL